MANWRGMVGRRAFARPGVDGDVLGRASDWVWPYWVERQLDPESPSYVPRVQGPFPINVTHRNWTAVGNLASPWTAVVDPRGLVTPWMGGWSLDWWIGAEDRWHLPSREPAVRQSRVGPAPVVETAMRIPGGDAVHRTYAIPAAAVDGTGELIVVEVENQSAVPVAVAFAVRPYNPEGLVALGMIEVGEHSVVVDGSPALHLPRAPAGVAGSILAAGDCVHRVTAGQTVASALAVEDPEGLAQAAVVYPLPHRTTIRVAMPLAPEHRPSPTLPRRHIRRDVPAAIDSSRWPAASDVARGWQAHLRRGVRVELPDPRLQAAIEAGRADLLQFHTGDNVAPAPWTAGEASVLEAASMVVTLDRFGFSAEAAQVLRGWPSRAPGPESGRLRNWEAHAGGLWAIAEHYRLTGDSALLGELITSVREGVRVLLGHLAAANLPYEDAFWFVRALVDGAALLQLAGDGPSAQDALAAADRVRDAITASLDQVAARLGRVAMPAAPGRTFDAGMIGALVACVPLGLLPPDDPWVRGTLEVLTDRFCLKDAFYDGLGRTGLIPTLTLRIARCELEAGEPKAWRRLRWLLDAATPTFAWPEAIHPRVGGGCLRDGHHGGSTAAFLGFIRQVLVREMPAGGVALATLFPPEWARQPLEVHDAPTHHGRISYALRWHGDRPALLWQCDRPGVTLTVPGLDRSFSTTEQSGEALLAPFRVRVPIPVEDADQN